MKLLHKHVAILATDGFEQAELEGPMRALENAGATVSIVSPKSGTIQGVQHDVKGDVFEVDIALEDARASEFDALLLPGGLMNPDALRIDEEALTFVRHFAEAGKPIGAICHAPWILINAGLVAGRLLTSWEAIAADVQNAGGNWINRDVVVDHGLVTSRKPADIPAFSEKLIEEIAEGRHYEMARAAGEYCA